MKAIRPALALVLFHLFCACRGEYATPAGSTAPEPQLVIAFPASPGSLDARVGSDQAAGRIFDLVYSGLVKATPNLDYAPDLATRWDTPDDRTIVFHLHPTARFHDGRPVTASDVKWTFESLASPELKTVKKGIWRVLDAIDTPDERTVVFRLKEPAAGIFDSLTLGIVPRDSDAEALGRQPIGSGPYRLVSHQVDERVEFEAFDAWHGGKPKIRKVLIRIIPEDATRVLEMRRGTVNFSVNTMPPDAIPTFENDPRFTVMKSPGSGYHYLAFNLRDPILGKRQVRRAIAHSIDRTRIIRDILRGAAVPAESLFPRDHWAYATGLPVHPYDPAKARALLREAGHPNGFELSFRTNSEPEMIRRAEVLQQMLAEVGIRMRIVVNEPTTFLSDLQKGRFQMFALSRFGIQDPDFYRVIFHSKNLPPDGQNRGYYINPRVDELIAQGGSTFDRAARRQAYAEVQRIVAEDLPYVSLYHQFNVSVMPKNVKGYTAYPAGFLLSVPQMYFE